MEKNLAEQVDTVISRTYDDHNGEGRVIPAFIYLATGLRQNDLKYILTQRRGAYVNLSNYLFEDKSISGNITYRKSESDHSQIFPGLVAELDRVFK